MSTNDSTDKPAIVLLSGGLDSATVLAMASAAGWRVHALTVHYGQRHAWELHCASELARRYKVAAHRQIAIDLRAFGGSALTSDVAVPKGRTDEAIGHGIPITYVPARNTVFLSMALAWGEVVGAADIFIGVNALDYSGYPDCRPEFIEAFERLANLATKAGVEGTARWRVHAPLMRLRKTEIIQRGMALGLDYGLTSSCYDPTPDGLACGACDSCSLRRKAFAELGIADPTRYASAG